MIIDGEKLIISFDMTLDELMALQEFVRPRLKYIDEIVSDDTVVKLKSLSLLQFLASIKKSKPEIKIPFLEAHNFVDNDLGTIRWNDLWM